MSNRNEPNMFLVTVLLSKTKLTKIVFSFSEPLNRMTTGSTGVPEENDGSHLAVLGTKKFR